VALLSPSGLCLECEGTDRSADATPRVPGADPAQAPTATAAPASSTAAEPPGGFAALPTAPGGYDLLERLGVGGMGVVYLAREQDAERLVAMKFLHFPGDAESFDRFLVELRVLALFDHPNVVRVLASDLRAASPYFTMEHMPNGSLARVVAEGRSLPASEAVRIARTVAEALATAHTRGVIHRDVKPSNILLAADGAPKLSDFGLAKWLERDPKLTRGSVALGTASYMPPEQVSRKNGEVGPWSDVYGLGATLYHLLTGRAPFAGETTEETILHVLADPPVRPRAYQPEIPAALEGIVLKCLEKETKDRYQTMAELIADLDRFAAGQKPLAPQLTPWRRLKRWARAHRQGVAVGVVAAALLAGAFALGAAYWPKPAVEAPPDPAELRAKRLETIRAELLAGRPVTLVGEKGEPLWHEAPTGTIAFGENPTGTGGCYFPSYELTILKFLDPVIDRYRVELEIQHVKGPAGADRPTTPCLGFFLGYGQTLREDGWVERSLLSLGFNDHARMIQGVANPSALLVESYCFNNPPGRLPSPHRMPLPKMEWPLDSPDGFPGPWRKVVAEVDPDRAVLYWHAKPGRDAKAEPLAVLTAADIKAHRQMHDVVLNAVGARIGHRFAPLPPWSPRQGLGVWAVNAEIAVKNVVVTPR
jgi:serine/threonine-protein kinase